MRLNGLFAFVAAVSHAAERCCLEDSTIRWRSFNRGRRKRHESYPAIERGSQPCYGVILGRAGL